MRGYDQAPAVRRHPMPAFMVAGGENPTMTRSSDRACPLLAAALVLFTMSAADTKLSDCKN